MYSDVVLNSAIVRCYLDSHVTAAPPSLRTSLVYEDLSSMLAPQSASLKPFKQSPVLWYTKP